MILQERLGTDARKTPLLVYRAGSVADFINTARQFDSNESWSDSAINGSRKFAGTDSLDGALSLARHGWKDGIKRMARGLDDLSTSAALPSIMPSYSYDVGGAFPDVAAYCAGDPEHMVTDESDWSATQSAVHIVIPGSYPSMMKASQVENYGIALLSVVDAIQRSGRSVALSWAKVSTPSEPEDYKRFGLSREPEYIGIETPVVQEGMALDLASVSFAFHPSMLRRLSFAVGGMKRELSMLGMGFGGATMEIPECYHEPGKIYVPGAWGAKNRGWLASVQECAAGLHQYIAERC